LLAVAACVACQLLFVNKAFHIDDPLFLWAAQHIQQHPADFFGFDVHWYSTQMKMSEVTQNPPGACYYLTVAAALFGWSEVALHLAFVLPAVALVWGTYRLAEMFGSRPLIAALATLFTPVFLVGSTSVMCDTMMTALWVWTLFTWELGLRRQSAALLWLAGLMIVLCALTKYFGMSLIPLLLAYSLVGRHPWQRWLGPLLLAVLALVGYQLLTRHMYGQGLLTNAASYATKDRSFQPAEVFNHLLITLSFVGGCAGSYLFYLPWLWSRRVLVGMALLVGLFTALSFDYSRKHLEGALLHHLAIAVQMGVFSVLGLVVLLLALRDHMKNRDARSLLLLLWVSGTFVFAGFVNWAVNGRSILPLIPAAGILVMRRIDRNLSPTRMTVPNDSTLTPQRSEGYFSPQITLSPEQPPSFATGPQKSNAASRDSLGRLGPALIPAAALTLLVTWADYSHADSARQAAALIAEEFGERPGTHWFQGHWGFQYYFEQQGGRAWDWHRSRMQVGDLMVVPEYNYFVRTKVPPDSVDLLKTIEVPTCRWLATMHPPVGAGFYADQFGPLPFAFGPVQPESYAIYEILKPYTLEDLKAMR
jgi:4-amino-4-deoxy-L-arabinose transferase-like glycosyltransferase